MGYTTDFSGQIDVVPPLSAEEVDYLTRFNETRRMLRRKGPYFVGGGGLYGQAIEADVIDGNRPPEGQPGLWCQWRPTLDGHGIEWDEGEKFYCAAEWMKYLIVHFLGTEPLAKAELPFLQGHTLNGVIQAQGEDLEDRWELIVEDNVVSVATFSRVRGEPVAI